VALSAKYLDLLRKPNNKGNKMLYNKSSSLHLSEEDFEKTLMSYIAKEDKSDLVFFG
jgi:hypothetical protein